MIIKNISIHNFQSYFGEQLIELSEGLNLIIGNGGKGKSKLFNAFYWVLFGKIYITGIGWCTTDELPISAKGTMKKHEFINMKALADAPCDSDVSAVVQIEIIDDKQDVYLISRTVTAHKLSDDWKASESWTVRKSELKVAYDTITGTKVALGWEAETKIGDLFPNDIRNYIWFQGESLESLINFRDAETLKSAVKHISYFPYYEKLSDIVKFSRTKIESLESKKIREANKHNFEVKKIIAEIDLLRGKVEKASENMADAQENIELIATSLAEGEKKLAGLASFSTLVKRYNDVESEIKGLNSQLDIHDKFQREKLPTLWVLRGIGPMMSKCKEIIANHTAEEATLPERKYLDNPGRAKLEEILHDGQCFVCGSKVSKGNDAYVWILNRMKEQDAYLREMEDYRTNMQFNKMFNMFLGKIQDYPDSLLTSISAIDKQYEDSEEKIDELLARRKKKLEDKRKLDAEIEEVKRHYGVDPVHQAETATIVSSTIKSSRSSLEREQKKYEIAKQEMGDYSTQLKLKEKEFEGMGSSSDVISVPETEWKKISIFLEDICKRVQENARKELLRKIEEKANEFYAKFTEHDKGYKGNVKISDDYSIAFDAGLNTSHEDRKKMSIINALLYLNQEAIGTYYPFISDAPTSNFDLTTTYKYLMGIKDTFGQIIIMTKDVDINSKNYQELYKQEKITRIYQLDSEVYSEDDIEPEINEVSTVVKQLK